MKEYLKQLLAEQADALARRNALREYLQARILESLLAGKVHALLSRPWLKGRDLYDLFWYLGDRSWPAPNLGLLGNALALAGWSGPQVTPANWRQLILDRLGSASWREALEDVRPFLERESDLAWLTPEHARKLLEPEIF